MPTQREKRTFASIRRRDSGRWQVRFTGPDGKRRSAPDTFAARVDAEAWVAAKRREIDRGLWDPEHADRPAPVTFEAYAWHWLAGRHVAGRPLKDRTREHYAALLRDHLLPAFGERRLSTITAPEVRTWHAGALAGRPTLRSHCYGLLRSILGTAVDDGLIPANPVRVKGAGRVKRVHKVRPATPEQIAGAAAAMPARLAPMVLLASWTALRFGELAELRRGDVDMSAEVVHVRRGVVRTAAGMVVTDPKSDAGARSVAIPPHILPVLEHHLAAHVDAGDDALLFPADHGGHLAPSTFQRHWYRARASIGRADLRFHDLRHSGATLAALAGATLAELMARLGHSTPTAALRYQHVAAGRDRELAALLSKLASDKP